MRNLTGMFNKLLLPLAALFVVSGCSTPQAIQSEMPTRQELHSATANPASVHALKYTYLPKIGNVVYLPYLSLSLIDEPTLRISQYDTSRTTTDEKTGRKWLTQEHSLNLESLPYTASGKLLTWSDIVNVDDWQWRYAGTIGIGHSKLTPRVDADKPGLSLLNIYRPVLSHVLNGNPKSTAKGWLESSDYTDIAFRVDLTLVPICEGCRKSQAWNVMLSQPVSPTLLARNEAELDRVNKQVSDMIRAENGVAQETYDRELAEKNAREAEQERVRAEERAAYERYEAKRKSEIRKVQEAEEREELFRAVQRDAWKQHREAEEKARLARVAYQKTPEGQAELAAERERKRVADKKRREYRLANWPKESVGMLEGGAWLCSTRKNALMSVSMERVGHRNAKAKGCDTVYSNGLFLSDIRAEGNGVSQVYIIDRGQYYFVGSNKIERK